MLISLDIIFEDSKVPSVNSMNWCKGGRRVSAPYYRSLQNKFKEVMSTNEVLPIVLDIFDNYEIIECTLDLIWYTTTHNRDGSVKKKDATSVLKPLEDMLASVIRIDDSYNFSVRSSKRCKVDPKSSDKILILYTVKLKDDKYESYNLGTVII
jgi:hypothetical protein